MKFLSEDNVIMHKEYVRTKKLQYSILEKSIPGLYGKSVNEILTMRLGTRDKSDALRLLTDISLHELFFTSFGDVQYERSDLIRSLYGSEGQFLNEMYRACLDIEYGFTVALLRGRDVRIYSANEYVTLFELGVPVLAVDVCEHAYFLDYGFDKEKYLTNALVRLNIGKIDKISRQNK